MQKNFSIISKEAYIQALDDMRCGKLAHFDRKDFQITQNDIEPLEGYSQPEGFPNCCAFHKDVLEAATQRFDVFPNCCELHKNLNSATWFKKKDYSYFTKKVLTSVEYAWHCISKCINNPNWYKEIKDYLTYIKESFGQLPEGYGNPVGFEIYQYYIQLKIDKNAEIEDSKKKKLLDCFKELIEEEHVIDATDINLLISKYKDWLKVFPFELSFLAHLKPYFENKIPILGEKGETNIYTGLTSFKLKTKKELVGFLMSVTFSIIKEINTQNLFKKGLLNNTQDIQLGIIMAKRKLEIEELEILDRTDRNQYINVLKKWLDGEKRFLKEINPHIKEEKIIFIKDFVEGIFTLQKNDTNETCIMNVRNNLPNKETSFRYWFKNFFTARYPSTIITAEEEKGKGRIDLKVTHKDFGTKIVEFKGWWNHDKNNSANQICSYLTDFENDGYIFMINHLRSKDIVPDYKNLIIQEASNYITDSWISINIPNTDFNYYTSKHKLATKEKSIHHFIFNVYF